MTIVKNYRSEQIMEWQEFMIPACGAIIAAALFVGLFTFIQNWPL
jgi:hypothetical protein